MTRASLRGAVAGRGFLLLPVAALAVHELRYRLAYGDEADAALAAQGHGYLDSLVPWLVLLLALGLGLFLVRVARSRAGRLDPHPRRSFVRLSALAAASLFAIHAIQELLEGSLTAAHPAGLSALVGHGGWWAIGAALVLGAAVAGLVRVADAVVVLAARPVATSRRRGRLPLRARPSSACLPRLPALAGAAAGRAPPAL